MADARISARFHITRICRDSVAHRHALPAAERAVLGMRWKWDRSHSCAQKAIMSWKSTARPYSVWSCMQWPLHDGCVMLPLLTHAISAVGPQTHLRQTGCRQSTGKAPSPFPLPLPLPDPMLPLPLPFPATGDATFQQVVRQCFSFTVA